MLIATQEYINNNGCPLHPNDLAQHNVFNLRHNGFGSTLKLSRGDECYEIDNINNRALSSNNHLSLINLCIEGKGITLGTPGWLKSNYAKQANLVTLMSEWTLEQVPVYLVWRPRKIYSPLFIAFRDYIEKKWIDR